MTGKPQAPAGLSSQQVKQLLDNLESNAAFRQQFQDSPEQALRSLGYTGATVCMTLKPGQTLASPEQIRAQRTKLERVMTLPHTQDCALSLQQAS